LEKHSELIALVEQWETLPEHVKKSIIELTNDIPGQHK
jgi:hypothetical protein